MRKSSWVDDKLMPWGKHKGAMLKDIPAEYLLWYFEQSWASDWPGFYAYVKNREDELRGEVQGDVTETGHDMETWDDYMDTR